MTKEPAFQQCTTCYKYDAINDFPSNKTCERCKAKESWPSPPSPTFDVDTIQVDDASEDKCWEGGCNTAKAAGSNFCAVHKQAPVVASGNKRKRTAPRPPPPPPPPPVKW